MKEGLTNEQQKAYAKLLFTHHHMSINEVAEATGVPSTDVAVWVVDEKWDGLRKSLLLTRHQQLNMLYDMLLTISNKITKGKSDDAKDMDKVLKLTAAIKNLEREDSIAYTIDVARHFTKWLKTEDPQLVIDCANALEKYIRHLETKR